MAKIYGRILRDLGLLSKGDVIVKIGQAFTRDLVLWVHSYACVEPIAPLPSCRYTPHLPYTSRPPPLSPPCADPQTPADFIGQALGQSEAKTRAILESSLGSVLVIDEAYGLYAPAGATNVYAEAVIETLVATVQGVPGDDRAVLLLGYKEPMERMMREANPGLARRFRMDDAWTFEDYSDEDLLRILRRRAERLRLELSVEDARAAVRVLARERMKPNFGNAGAVNNLLSRATERMEARQMAAGLSDAARAADRAMRAEDFLKEGGGGAPVALEDLFADLVGCDGIVSKLRELQATIAVSQELGQDPLEHFEMNFLFLGSPGTGKTTVARRMGRMFESLGLLGSSEVVECSPTDFGTGYVGQAALQTRKVFERALGKVLFIDEAYGLNPNRGGPYMRETLDEIVKLLTDPQFKSTMVVILAGYEAEIEELMNVNPGLRSRISTSLKFANLTPPHACDLLRSVLAGKSARLADGAEGGLGQLMARLVAAPGWSNGRTVSTWATNIFTAVAVRRQAAGVKGTQGASSPSSWRTSRARSWSWSAPPAGCAGFSRRRFSPATPRGRRRRFRCRHCRRPRPRSRSTLPLLSPKPTAPSKRIWSSYSGPRRRSLTPA